LPKILIFQFYKTYQSLR